MGALKALLTLGIPRTYPRVVLGLIARFWFTVNYEYGKDETQFLFYVYMSVLFFVSLVCSACTSCFTPSKGRRSRPQIRARLASSRTGSRWTTACSSLRHASSSPSHPLSCKWPLNPIAWPSVSNKWNEQLIIKDESKLKYRHKMRLLRDNAWLWWGVDRPERVTSWCRVTKPFFFTLSRITISFKGFYNLYSIWHSLTLNSDNLMFWRGHDPSLASHQPAPVVFVGLGGDAWVLFPPVSGRRLTLL